MKVKRFVADTTSQAMSKVKNELGKDAVIIHTRKIRKKGISGLFSKHMVEVVAAVDSIIDTKSEINVNESVKRSEQNTKEQLFGYRNILNSNNPLADNAKRDYDYYYKKLIESEVSSSIADEIIKKAVQLYKKENKDFAYSLESILINTLGAAKPIELNKGEKKTIMFLGPTGVGKTTTLAKLAAIYSIQEGKKVSLITADTYRIAAVDQLKIYAEILGIPIDIVYTPEDIEDAVQKNSDSDLILIDTAGKSLNDKKQVQEVERLLNLSKTDEIFLVVSSNTSFNGCKQILKSYEFLPNYRMIFTKLDEAASIGIILNCSYLSGRPLSYITTGQNVPDDIEVADSYKIVNLLWSR